MIIIRVTKVEDLFYNFERLGISLKDRHAK